MDRDGENKDESTHLLRSSDGICSKSEGNLNEAMASSSDTIVFDSKMIKTSTVTGELAATWGGRCSLPESGRLRRIHSWSGGPPHDHPSEIRILRERYSNNLLLMEQNNIFNHL